MFLGQNQKMEKFPQKKPEMATNDQEKKPEKKPDKNAHVYGDVIVFNV